MNKYLIILIISFCILIAGMTTVIRKQRKLIHIKSDNLESLQVGVVKFKANDSLNAAIIGRLQQNNSDLNKYNSDLAKHFKSLNISVRKLQTAIKTNTVTKFHNITNVKDTTIRIRDTTQVTISVLEDPWISFYHAMISNETDSLYIAVKSNIYNFIYWDRKGFWPTRFLKRKKYYLVSKSDNPYLTIDSLQYVECSKKK